MDLTKWKNAWENNRIGFHLSDINPFLIRYNDKFTKGKKGLKIFVPLCGKTKDMRWLLEQGHSVVGVEISEIAINDFMKENNYEYTTEDSSIGKVMKTKDGKCKLYACDLYDYTSTFDGCFDGIWDRGSYVAINPDDRQKYLQLMKSLLVPSGMLLMETYSTTNPDHKGPPHSITHEMVMQATNGIFKVDFSFSGNNKEDKDAIAYLTFFRQTEHTVTVHILGLIP